MNPHARASRRIKNADSQRRRRLDPERREEENEQRRTRREEPGVIEQESIQRAVAREQPGVIEHVALRPGDFLLFNPQEPHSISSRCCAGDEVFCISSYLKTGVVGDNDNSNTVV